MEKNTQNNGIQIALGVVSQTNIIKSYYITNLSQLLWKQNQLWN